MRRRQGNRLGSWGWAWVLAAVLGGPSWAAPPPVEVETLRAGFEAQGRSNLFKIGAWTPVTVQLRAGASGFAGYLDVVVPDDDETPTTFRQRVDVGAKESRRFVTYARPGTRDPEFTLRLLDDRGRRVAPDVNGNATAQLSPVGPGETLLLTLGKPQGVEQVPGLPAFQIGQTPGMMGASEVVVAGLDAFSGHLPGRWYGYDAASVVVLDTNDRRVMAEFDQYRGTALEDWVKRGGHLVVAVGANWQAVQDSFIAPMLPAVATGQEQVGSLEALDTFVGTGSTKPITPADSKAKALVTKFEQVEPRGGKVLAKTSNLPLVVRGSYGFGRVTAIAIDVDQRPFADWADRPLFWVKALDLPRRGADAPAGAAPVPGGARRYFMAYGGDLASRLRSALEQFPGVKLVPFGWVAFFIFLYILLIGPGDYFFLKKVLKRMELTWITFPVIVVSVSLLAYYAAYVVKGSELRVNQVDIVDVDQKMGVTRGSSWVNIFSPQNRDYDVKVVPLPLDRDLPAGAEPARPAGTEVLMSWFGDPQAGFGGMGQGGRLGFSSGGYAYQPAGAAESLEGVRVAIWSTKCLTARWFGAAQPVIDSDLRKAGVDGVEGTVTNELDTPLNNAMLVYASQVYELGTIAPHASITVNIARSPRHLVGLLRERTRNLRPDQFGNTPGTLLSRPDLMFALMFSDTQAATADQGVLTNDPLHYVDLSGQLALRRPMLVAQASRPGARLLLGSAKADKVDQTTMLRVVLDEPAEEGAPAKEKAKGAGKGDKK